MKTIVDTIRFQLNLTDGTGQSLNKMDANRVSDDKMKELEEALKTKLGDKGYTSIEVVSETDRDDGIQLKRTIVATAYLDE